MWTEQLLQVSKLIDLISDFFNIFSNQIEILFRFEFVFKSISLWIELFIRRCRKVEHNNSPYELVPATLNTYSDSITADLINKNNGHLFVLKVEGVQVRFSSH